MLINDKIYGEFNISEPVLVELIRSDEIRRLRKINQVGLLDKHCDHPNFKRYNHSIGVMLLLKRLDASLEEQIAGLLHDVSHTAFSHIYDWVVGSNADEDFQDINHDGFLRKSSLPQILSNHGFDISDINDLEKFALLESPAPAVCADRIDYSLREFQLWANPGAVQTCLNSLVNHDGDIVFDSFRPAYIFAMTYMKLQTEHWASASQVLKYYLFADALKIAINNGVITHEDFMVDDEHIMKKIYSADDKGTNDALAILKRDMRFEEVNEGGILLPEKKFRYVDPQFLRNEIYRLSEVDKDYKKLIESERINNSRELRVRLI